MKRTSLIMLALVLAVGCNKTPVDSVSDPSNAPQEIQMVGAQGSAAYQLVTASEQATNHMRGASGQWVTPDVTTNLQSMSQRAMNMVQPGLRKASNNVNAQPFSPEDRQLIWDVRWTDEKTGSRYHAILEYDPTTGHAFIYQVALHSGEIVYDSTAVELDANFTLADSTDDMLIRYDQLLTYRSASEKTEEQTHVEFDPYDPGGEPKTGRAESIIVYAAGHNIQRIEQSFESHASDAGIWEKRTVFQDNRENFERVTFQGDGTGTLQQDRADGTHVTGTFDTIEDDGQGALMLTTTFPKGHDPVSTKESWTGTFSDVDSTLDCTFEKTTIFADGTQKDEKYKIDEFIRNGNRGKTITAVASNGEKGEITFIDQNGSQEIDGWWVEEEGHYIQITGLLYDDGQARLEIVVYASEQAFQSNEPPLFTGIFNFYPDGSGKGQVSDEKNSYAVHMAPNGKQTIQ